MIDISHRIDIAILGGGLAGGLIKLAMAHLHPGLRVVLIEQDDHFGGNHVWSWFRRDVSRLDDWLVMPLVAHRWQGYDVHFPAHSRQLRSAYSMTTSEKLDAHLRSQCHAADLITGARVTDAGPCHFELSDGRRINVGGVIDARGGGMAHLAGGWQKFAGQLLRLEAPHGLERPVVMDARVDQHDGYRFVYCLPFSSTEVFVEDTYYSCSPTLDKYLLHDRIAAYAKAQGWRIAEIAREETGVLPVIAAGDFAAFWQAGGKDLAKAGTRAAMVHPLTGYSLPDAVRFACHICKLRNYDGEALARSSHTWALARWRRSRFERMLARMLFCAGRQQERYRIFERFYTLDEPLIERFYASKPTWRDRLRLLAGKPPVPVWGALASLLADDSRLASLGTTQ